MATTFKERAEKLRDHADTVVLEVGGDERAWFLGKLTFRLARERDIDLAGVIAAFDGMDDNVDISEIEGLVDRAGQLLYAGMLPFEEDLDEEDVTDYLSVGDLQRLLPQLLATVSEQEAPKKVQAAKQKQQSAADRKKGRA